MARAPREVANGTSANFGSSNRARRNPRTTLAHKMPDLVVPHLADAHADTAPTNTPGPLPPGGLDSAPSIKLASPRIGLTSMDVSLGECCGFKEISDHQAKSTVVGSGTLKRVLALRLRKPLS